jgi:Nitrogen permease regulator 2
MINVPQPIVPDDCDNDLIVPSEVHTIPSDGAVVPVVPPPPPPQPPAFLRTPDLIASSPSVSPWLSSVNTTPRQSGKRCIPDSNHERKISATGTSGIRSSFNSSISSKPNKAPSTTNVTTTTSFTIDDHSADRTQLMNSSYPILAPAVTPKHPSQCSLLCCFYAEFDIKVGPKICYQCPTNFMEQDIRSTSQQLEKLLLDAFRTADNKAVVSSDTHPETSSSGQTPKAVGSRHKVLEEEATTTTTTAPVGQNTDDTSLISSSIFDSCSEYIITGSELTGNIINLSTHHVHLVTRPTMIIDENYERNTLLFCVGFVLRRMDDPQPYRPILSKLALTLRDMEIESQFLSQNREQIQPMLEGILISLNSPTCECNLILGTADVLHLKLFRPPRPPATPVRDHSVPILLRRDWQQQAVSAILW